MKNSIEIMRNTALKDCVVLKDVIMKDTLTPVINK